MRPPFIGVEAHVAPVTLVVAVLDDALHLPALLAGIEGQTISPAELLIADRGSTDGTAQLLHGWSPPPLVSFKVIDAPGTSVAEARNLAVESASYDSVVVTEAAARPEPGWIAQVWASLALGAAAASGRVRATGSDPVERALALVRMPARPAAVGANMAFTRSVWDDVGGYPEWLEAGHDEVFAAALRGAGTTIVDVPDAVVAWSPGPSLRGFAADSFRDSRACGQAEIVRAPGLGGIAIATALVAGACIRRSLGLMVVGAIVVRSEKALRDVWRSRGDAVDPLGVRIVLTVAARLLSDVTAAAGYAVGRFAALCGTDPVKARSDRRARTARYGSGAVSLAAAAAVCISVRLTAP